MRSPCRRLLLPLNTLTQTPQLLPAIWECVHVGMNTSKLIGASLSEPHTSVTALAEVVCMYVCLFVAIYRKF